MSDNTITLSGNVTRDPELRYTTGGKAVASFGLAVNRRYQTGGEWQEHTSFFEVVAWGTLGENAAGSLAKGNRIVVSGRMDQRNWETEEGDKRSKLEVVADEIGASLRWAKVQIEKVTRTESDPGSPADTAPEGEEPF